MIGICGDSENCCLGTVLKYYQLINFHTDNSISIHIITFIQKCRDNYSLNEVNENYSFYANTYHYNTYYTTEYSKSTIH